MADQPPVHVPSMVRLRPTPIRCSALRFSQVGLHSICDSHGIIRFSENLSIHSNTTSVRIAIKHADRRRAGYC